MIQPVVALISREKLAFDTSYFGYHPEWLFWLGPRNRVTQAELSAG
jgi:hypothetical protein